MSCESPFKELKREREETYRERRRPGKELLVASLFLVAMPFVPSSRVLIGAPFLWVWDEQFNFVDVLGWRRKMRPG